MKRQFLSKKIIWKVRHDVRATYLHIQESSKRYSYNTVKISQYYRNIFKCFFSTLKDIIQSQNKTNHWISWNLIIICLKGISKECFLLSVNMNISLKFLAALGGLSEGNQALGVSEGTCALRVLSKGTRALGYLRHSDTRILRVLGLLVTRALRALKYLDTRELKALGCLDTWVLEALYIAGSQDVVTFQL